MLNLSEQVGRLQLKVQLLKDKLFFEIIDRHSRIKTIENGTKVKQQDSEEKERRDEKWLQEELQVQKATLEHYQAQFQALCRIQIQIEAELQYKTLSDERVAVKRMELIESINDKIAQTEHSIEKSSGEMKLQEERLTHLINTQQCLNHYLVVRQKEKELLDKRRQLEADKAEFEKRQPVSTLNGGRAEIQKVIEEVASEIERSEKAAEQFQREKQQRKSEQQEMDQRIDDLDRQMEVLVREIEATTCCENSASQPLRLNQHFNQSSVLGSAVKASCLEDAPSGIFPSFYESSKTDIQECRTSVGLVDQFLTEEKLHQKWCLLTLTLIVVLLCVLL